MNSVAHEVAVVAAGARPGKTGERELFTEETTTVLLFENGGVLRLAAAVVPGQLLFLTNKKTRREVVAQVTRKRDFKPTSCYVEVEFSEPSPGFWGIEFPETPQLAPATPQQKEAAELVHSAKVISGKPSAPAPSAQEVTALKQEVEALREQLKQLQTQAAPAPAAIVDPPPSSAIAAASIQPAASLPRAAADTPPSLPAALPMEPEGSFSEALHTPKPVIRVNRPVKAKGTAGGSLRAKPLLITLLFAAALIATLGGAWHLDLIPWLAQPKPVSASTPPALAAQPTTATPGPASPMTANATNTVNSTSPTAAAIPQLSVESKSAAQPAPADTSVDPEPVQERSRVPASTGQRSVPRPSIQTTAAPAGPLSQGAGVVPPKLIKSIRAIASPNALEYFARDKTATVTLDAVVDASGRVKAMKVISGPASLRDSAIEALKQYRYEPATSRGKPVAAHVTVPIKFLFEP